MAMQPRLFSIEGLAVELGRDRRTVAKALRGVPAEGETSGRPAWRIATAVAALRRREDTNGGSNHHALEVATREAERLADEIEEAFERMRQQPDVIERRRMAVKYGPLVGALERALQAGLDALSPGPAEREFLGLFQDHMIGNVMGEFLDICQWRLRVDGEQPAA
jgi:hypothetical protein